LHDFLFLGGEQGVDVPDRLVGRFLNLRFVPFLIVLADRVLLQQPLEDV
jgi:hypothetical protein